MSGPTIIRLGVDPERHAEMQALARRCGHPDLPAMFNAAITLLEWAAGEVEKGVTVGSVNDKERSYVSLNLSQMLPGLYRDNDA